MTDQGRTCFQYESGTYGFTSGNRQWIGLVQNHDATPSMNVIPIRYQGSTDRNVDDFANGMKEFNGTISYLPQDWKFLGFAIGSIQDLTGSHIFTENNSDNVTQIGSEPLYHFTIEDSKNLGTPGENFIRTIIGGMVDSYTINYTQGELVSCDIDYIAQSETMSSGAVTALAATTTAPYVFNNAQLQVPSGTLVSNLREGTFVVNNNLERGNYLNGSRVSHELLPMNRDYEVTATCVMDEGNARTFYDSYYIAGSTFNSMLKFEAAAGSLCIVMSGCKMTEMTVPSPLEGVQEQTFTFVPSHCYPVAYDDTTKYNAW
ncbi:MAG: phage tail tube protein [Candidatus Thorarchaeota archaeon]